MNSAIKSGAAVVTGAVAVWLGSAASSAQATVDAQNSYPHVGAIMVWRVDDSGTPVELRGFASGTLIRPSVMITAGHFTAPVKALGGIPPTIRIFASFSAMDARDPGTCNQSGEVSEKRGGTEPIPGRDGSRLWVQGAGKSAIRQPLTAGWRLCSIGVLREG
jgi:hypothetical protein